MAGYGAVPLATSPVATHVAQALGRFEFELHPQLWRDPSIRNFYQGRVWNYVDFISTPPMSLPATSGIYMFVVSPRCADLIDHSYIFYFGQTKNFRQRYRQYLLERQNKGSRRPPVVHFLSHFDGFIQFHYTPVPVPQLDEAENLLKDNLRPYGNERLASLKGRITEARIA